MSKIERLKQYTLSFLAPVLANEVAAVLRKALGTSHQAHEINYWQGLAYITWQSSISAIMAAIATYLAAELLSRKQWLSMASLTIGVIATVTYEGNRIITLYISDLLPHQHILGFIAFTGIWAVAIFTIQRCNDQ
jgi:hypothetical protein